MAGRSAARRGSWRRQRGIRRRANGIELTNGRDSALRRSQPEVVDGAAAWRSYRRNIFRSRSHRDRKVSTITTMLLADRYADVRETTRISERDRYRPQRTSRDAHI